MPDDGEKIGAGKGSDGARKGASKVKLLTLDELDGRTTAAKRVRETRAEVIADLGGEANLSTMERIAVDNVAMLDAMLKDASARWLMGEALDVSVIATLQNTFNRTATAIGWQRRARDVTPDVRSYMTARAGDSEAA